MKRNRVNVLTVVNPASNITTETIDGKPHIVVRGITPVVDDIVMNRKLYPATEIEKAYNTLERNPMPLGHPKVDGKHVSARDVRAVNEYHVGAWLQNVSYKDGKVTGDMYVNRQYAESSDKGKRLINRLDEMLAGTNSDPIHISTGLLYSGIAANGESKGKKYDEIATNMMFDHVAVLLDEPGAGTPEEGVGKDGLKLVGTCNDLPELKTVSGEFTGQQIFLTSYHTGKNLGGGIFQWDSVSTKQDDGGCIIQAAGISTGRWIRQNVVEKTPEMYGALGDGNQDDWQYIQRMFDSENNHSVVADDFFGNFRLSRKYKMSQMVDCGKPIYVNAMGARFIMSASVPAFTFIMHNGCWAGGYFDYDTLLTNEQIDENAVALWPLKNVDGNVHPEYQVMHSKIRSIRSSGAHTGFKIDGAGVGAWHLKIELCEFGVRAGSSSYKGIGVDIEGRRIATTVTIDGCSVQDFTGSPPGAGIRGYRLHNISGGVQLIDISMDDATVGPRDIIECYTNNVLIQGFHCERIVNDSTAGVEGPIYINAQTSFIDGLKLLQTDTRQNCAWITPINPSFLTIGNVFHTKNRG